MSDFDAGRVFLDEVLAHPEDDAPRMIYADFLEEMGDPRGEFIRLQCELDHMDQLNANYLDIAHRCSEILAAHRQSWASELKQDVRKVAFARGFIDKITMRARAFITQGEALYRSTPVNWLRFNYVKGAGEQLAATDALNHVRSLDLGGLSIPDHDMRALLTSPNLSRLRALNLAHFETLQSDDVGTALAEMPAAQNLRSLEIPSGEEFLRAMARNGSFPKLEHLSIGTAYTDSSMVGITGLQVPSLKGLKCGGMLHIADTEVLAQLPIKQLETLNLESSRVPARGLQIFAEAGTLDEIRILNLRNCGLGIRTAGILFAGQRLAKCESLDLSLNRNLGLGGRPKTFMEYIIAHEPLRNLKHLSLGGLLPGDLAVLATCPHLSGLRSLALDSTRLGPHDLAALADSPIADSLRKLSLSSCDASLDSIINMAAERPFPELLVLQLGGGYDDITSFDELRVGALAESGSFPALQSLELDFMRLSSRTLRTIADTAELPELRQISYRDNQTSRKSIDAVMTSSRFPKLAKLLLKGTGGYGDRTRLFADYGTRIEI